MPDRRFPVDQLEAFVKQTFQTAGLSEEQAAEAAYMLLISDIQGIASHGLGRLRMYVERLERGADEPASTPIVERESASTLAIDGNHAPGLLVGPYAMRRTIEKAKESGICMTTVRRSNHYGIAGTYVRMAVAEGLGGISLTNATPLVVPLRSRKPLLGTNPIAFAVPTSGEPFVLDMATSTVSWGKIEIARRAGVPIPLGWGVDEEGLPTTDAQAVRGMTPLGGARESGGHKGYGLGVMVEILCGALAGNVWSNYVRRREEDTEEPGTGHFFMAWRIDAFRDPDEFIADMDAMCAELREAPTAADAPGPVLIPGDPEMEAERVSRAEGVPVADGLIAELRTLAERLQVPDPFG